jgi:AcrR family transcriptional regulator
VGRRQTYGVTSAPNFNWTAQYNGGMAGTAGDEPERRLTARGVRTKARIVSSAADLMRVKGVDSTTMDDVRAASGTSKSQIYHHYRDKNELVRDVIEFVGDWVIRREQDRLGRVSTLNGLRRWRDALVQDNDLRHGAYGCALGSLAGDVADHDEAARAALSRLFRAWSELISEALVRMQDGGVLKPDVDPDYLANGLLAYGPGPGHVVGVHRHAVGNEPIVKASAGDRPLIPRRPLPLSPRVI